MEDSLEEERSQQEISADKFAEEGYYPTWVTLRTLDRKPKGPMRLRVPGGGYYDYTVEENWQKDPMNPTRHRGIQFIRTKRLPIPEFMAAHEIGHSKTTSPGKITPDVDSLDRIIDEIEASVFAYKATGNRREFERRLDGYRKWYLRLGFGDSEDFADLVTKILEGS